MCKSLNHNIPKLPNSSITLTPNLKNSYEICKKITLGHYENFPVASLLVAKHLRNALFAVYAFARTADDAADENPDKAEAVTILKQMRDSLNLKQKKQEEEKADRDEIENSLFPALHDTIDNFKLPKKYFNDLLNAFEYDVNHEIFPTYRDMIDYCQNSAVPVGRIVLALHGLHEEPLLKYSDEITTALQLANFWQDISVDINKNDFSKKNKPGEKKELISQLVQETREMFEKGKPLLKYLPFKLRQEIRLTISGGMTILKKVEELGENIFTVRPKLTKWDWIKVIAGG
ncbi:MAG: squalene/phytoene synthase family protein [Calditrichia bacterium]|nr:squalene/phytoene synthase family protein [Calditrichia bacterium]